MSGYGFAAGYDAEDRLTSWDRADTNLDQSWDLSPVGDWNSITENASVQNRTHGPVHEILTAASQAVQHDPKGNMTLIPPVLRPGSDPLKLKWDFDNKLRAADTDDSGTDDVFYRWDALGRRVGRDDGTTDIVYFQDGQQTLADYPAGTAAGSPSYTYVYASYIDEVVLRSGGSGLRYYHRNQQYSITALTDGGGSIVERYAYTAYGQVTFANASGTVQAASASNNRYTYTGREWDQGLRLYHYRARMYDAVAGRFVSRDPIGYGQALKPNRSLPRYMRLERIRSQFEEATGRSDGSRLIEILNSQGFTQRDLELVEDELKVLEDDLEITGFDRLTKGFSRLPVEPHIYAYVNARPLTSVDPTGKWGWFVHVCVVYGPRGIPMAATGTRGTCFGCTQADVTAAGPACSGPPCCTPLICFSSPVNPIFPTPYEMCINQCMARAAGCRFCL